uniref:Uncharacterized protein n=1 Tax=Leishmania guyanensis TaxID=5670 RepID=A0A1E1J9K5_LEIGU|nr:Hypothetical protein BN36_NA76480 [Leishmania guyanensis]CCM43475.1 Hypothetical protein BN36_NA76820 [Leishmania guyanensis]
MYVACQGWSGVLPPLSDAPEGYPTCSPMQIRIESHFFSFGIAVKRLSCMCVRVCDPLPLSFFALRGEVSSIG